MFCNGVTSVLGEGVRSNGDGVLEGVYGACVLCDDVLGGVTGDDSPEGDWVENIG